MDTGKRKREPSKKTRKGTKAPRRTRTQRSMIPGLLQTTGNEKKVIFTGTASNMTALRFNSTGSILALNLIQVGSSMFNRIGRKLEMISVRFTGYIYPTTTATATTQTDFGRVAIIYDRQTNGAYPTISDIIQDTDQAGANTTTAMSGINMNNRERFVVIMDKRCYLPQVTNTAGVASNMQPSDTDYFMPLIDEYRRLQKLTTHYKADSNPAVIGDISTGGLYVITFGDNPVDSDNYRLDWNCRLKYVDL